ncbi:peptidylprolyl isomerase [Massilia antarctica]|uniref:peptidylprolyl isomerase n=1 Tax=Massilia antarctica TaxID=2765360 RepID=UPI0006BD955D|nr:peptidylprolyl isomerase [Massilia sp. H27-R4]MCY0915004.1 peptidylprolyl isomerase [Massilia sp. H27-R4]CUI06972.1 Peptidyl-prolyl cis-trans isomerase [Janthinobacterium sp. CG23_2]CUU30758.1 Peptidyl-prolyl cis-trans isomerase [Janthinobacterium sp. CG23_2]
MLIKSRVLFISAASALALAACGPKDAAKAATPASASTPVAKDGVAATVNGTPISTATVDMMVKERTAQGQPDSPELRKAIIDNLAMQTLVANEGVKKGLDKSDDVKRQMDLIKQSMTANAYIQEYIKANPVTDAMIKAEYDKMVGTAGGTEFKARHILVKDEAEAKSIIAKLKKDPKAFASLAKEKSNDPGSKVNGGDLGWFNPASMVPEFGAAVAKLEKGKFTDEPVKSQFGYHVIMLEDSRPITPPPFEQLKDQLKQQVQRTNMKAYLDKLKADAKIVYTSPMAAPAPAPAAPGAMAPAAGDGHDHGAAPAAATPAASK